MRRDQDVVTSDCLALSLEFSPDFPSVSGSLGVELKHFEASRESFDFMPAFNGPR